MEQFSITELNGLYPTAESRERLLQVHSLTMLLTNCVINEKYRVPDGLHTPISLTKYGDRVAERLRKQGVPFPESRVLCLLDMLGPQPLVDVENTDISALERSISNQVKSRDINFPMMFGRELYDKFAGAHSEEKLSLSAKETWEFLAGTSQGVVQANNFVAGPFGILRSVEARFVAPTLSVPLQHCADHSCPAVHRIALSTSYDAPINEHRSKISKILERDGAHIDVWFSFFDSFATRYRRLSQSSGEPLVVLVGDSMTDDELRSMLRWLLDNSNGELRAIVTAAGRRGSSEAITNGLSRAQLLQLIWSTRNSFLVEAIDRLVEAKVIHVPDGETRRAVINGGASYGPYGLIAEMNRLGVRLYARRTAIAPLRMRQLIEKMYNLSEESDRAELAWQLRARPDESVEQRLERHLRDEDPREVLTRLVLARRSNVVVASEYLQIGIRDDDTPDDSKFIDTVLWKLGFPIAGFPDINGELFDLHDRMMLLIRQVSPAVFDSLLVELRGLASNYFVKLEEVLRDCLSFGTWALTTDHYATPEPFVYRDDRDGVPSFLSLNEASADDPPERKIEYTDRPTMYALCRGFERLAVMLSGQIENEEAERRAKSDRPHWADEKDGLQTFPFEHRSAYLDLEPHAQEHIGQTLREASRALIGADVPDLRNKLMHPRLNMGDVEQLRSSLGVIRDTLSHLEADGFCRLTYTLASFEGDSTFRERTTLAHSRGYKYTLYLPSSYSWLRMPSDTAPQYVMQAAHIRGDAEVLRFVRKVYSPFAEMYDDFPVRPAGAGRSQVGSPSHSLV